MKKLYLFLAAMIVCLTASATKDLYLAGENFGRWNLDTQYKMTAEGNVYTIVLPNGLSGEWKIWDGQKDSSGEWTYSFGAGGEQPVVGTESEVWFGSSTNFTVSTSSKTTIQLTIPEGSDVKDSSTAAKLLITTESGETPVTPSKDLYLAGENFGRWNLDTQYKMTAEGNVYTIVLPNGLSGEWKIWDGQKDSSGEWTYSFGAGDNQPVVGTESDVWFGSSKNFNVSTSSKTTIQLTIPEGSDVKDSSTAAKLLITTESGETPVDPVDPAKDLYLVGEKYGNWTATEAYKMTAEGNVYTIVVPEGLSGEWKIWNGEKDGDAWAYSFGAGGEQPVVGTEYDAWFNSAANFTVETTSKTTIQLTVTEGSDVKDSSVPAKLLITTESGEDPVDPVDPVNPGETLYLVGTQYGNWTAAEDYKMTANGNVYTIVVPEGLSGEWKIWNGEKDGDAWAYSFGAGGEQPVVGTEYDAWFNSAANFTVETTSKTTIQLTVTEGSDVKDSSVPAKLLITTESGEDPVDPVDPVDPDKSYTFHGSIQTGEWIDLTTTEENGKWSYTGSVIAGEFGIKVLDKEGTQTAWYAATADAKTIDTENLDQAIPVASANAVNFENNLTGNYTFTFDPAAMTLTVSEAGDVPTPEVELYLMTPASGWNASEANKFTKSDDTYTLSVSTLSGEFKVASADWKEANYGAEAEGSSVQNGVAVNAVSGSQFNFNLASSLDNVTIKFVINADKSGTLTVTGTDGLYSIYSADGNIRVANGQIAVDGASDYAVYTTGGALVARNHAAQVEPGFYIVVVGDKAQKVVVK